MGLFDSIFGGEEQTQAPDQILQSGFGGLEPAFDYQKGAEALQKIATDRIGQTLDPFNIPESTPGFDFDSFLSSSRFGQPLYNELINPQFAPQTSSEQSLINELISQMQGQTAVRGLDPTFASIAETIAPQLIGLRQQRLGNLQGAFGGELEGVLGGRGQDIGERGADIAAGLTGRGQDIDFLSDKTAQAANIFTSLLGLDKRDTVVGGGGVSGSGGSGILSSLGGLGGIAKLPEAISGIGSVAKSIGSIFSDRRLKENIVKIGQLLNGLFVYSFNYLWDKESRIGVMSDEVRDLIPDAVSVHSSGYDLVDYAKVIK